LFLLLSVDLASNTRGEILADRDLFRWMMHPALRCERASCC
jgi:hypothetical protein